MSLFIQDPSFPSSDLLHDKLIDTFRNAVGGGGAYAFVSRDGVQMLMENADFETMIERGPYTLVVGTDHITNEAALTKLSELKNAHNNLTVFAFLHEHNNSIFHPKYSWFRNENGGTLVIGSGNLTVNGLRRNQEAFSI